MYEGSRDNTETRIMDPLGANSSTFENLLFVPQATDNSNPKGRDGRQTHQSSYIYGPHPPEYVDTTLQSQLVWTGAETWGGPSSTANSLAQWDQFDEPCAQYCSTATLSYGSLPSVDAFEAVDKSYAALSCKTTVPSHSSLPQQLEWDVENLGWPVVDDSTISILEDDSDPKIYSSMFPSEQCHSGLTH